MNGPQGPGDPVPSVQVSAVPRPGGFIVTQFSRCLSLGISPQITFCLLFCFQIRIKSQAGAALASLEPGSVLRGGQQPGHGPARYRPH